MQSQISTAIKDKLNKNILYENVTKYIVNNKEGIFTFNEALNISKYLLMENKFNVEDILVGKANTEIEKHILLKNIKNNSIIKENETGKLIPLKSIKKNIDKELIKDLIGKIISISLIEAIIET